VRDILKLLNDFKIVKTYEIIKFEQINDSYLFKCKISLIDDTDLFVLESLRNGEINYSYHWQDHNMKLITRWDNAPHHKEIGTYPHHLHDPDLKPSNKVNLEELLTLIEKKIQSKNPINS
jgi:hypothetical protein